MKGLGKKLGLGFRCGYLKYLGQFDSNYIIFRNVEIFKNYFFQIKKNILKEK
jgi:hypothetical protein